MDETRVTSSMNGGVWRTGLIVAIALCLGVALAEWGMPHAIKSWYHQEYPVRLLPKKPDLSHSLMYYTQRYVGIANALMFAMAFQIMLCLKIRKTQFSSLLKWVIGCTSGMALLATVAFGDIHDYWVYVRQWKDVWNGHPWGQSEFNANAYGPLYNLLALLIPISRLLPKLLFVCAWLTCGVWLASKGASKKDHFALVVFLLMNPFFWVLGTAYGHFDLLVGVSVLLAVHLRMRSNDLASGFLLGCAVLLKFYPIVLLPFLALEGRTVRFRVLAGCVVTVGVGFGASLLLWGPSTFWPFLFATERESKLLSLFAFLRGPYSPLQLNLDGLSMPALALGGLGVFVTCFARRVPVLPSCLAAMLVTLLFYKVGHQQFHETIFLLLAYWSVADTARSISHGRLVYASILYCVWLTLFQVLYFISGWQEGYHLGLSIEPWVQVRYLAGLPSFFIMGWLLFEVLVAGTRAGQRTAISNLESQGTRRDELHRLRKKVGPTEPVFTRALCNRP